MKYMSEVGNNILLPGMRQVLIRTRQEWEAEQHWEAFQYSVKTLQFVRKIGGKKYMLRDGYYPPKENFFD